MRAVAGPDVPLPVVDEIARRSDGIPLFVEQLADDAGIVWPKSIAPFEVHLVVLGKDADGPERKAADALYDELREALLTLKTKTILGDFAVDQRGFQTAQKAVTIQWQDGKRIVVWPDDLANGKVQIGRAHV